MKKYLSSIMVFISISACVVGQSFDWATATGGGGSDQAYAIATDASGNSYVTGWFSGSANFGDIVLNSEGGKDIYLAKYNGNGEILWAKRAWGVASNSAAGICLDWDGFPIITGWFAESIHFDEITLESWGSYDMFVARYNSEGDVIWAKSAGGEGDDYGNRVTTNLEYDVLVSGSFRYTANFGEETTVTSEGNRDIFIANYSNEGNFHWVKRAGGEGEDRAYDIISASDGSTYFTGLFNGKAYFGEHDINCTSLLGTYVAKMNAGGNFLWVRKGHGGANDYARGFGISMDGEGYVYSTGAFSGSLTFGEQTVAASGGQYDFDMYIAKHNHEGGLAWIKKGGGYGSDQGFDIYTNSGGESFVTGFFSNIAEFGGQFLESAGKSDIFIAKYNWAGEVEWLKLAGGDYQDYGYGISHGNTSENNLYICGNYQEEAAFDDIIISNWGNFDMFTAKLNFDGDFVVENNNNSFIISPNPSNGTFEISLNSPHKTITIQIFSSDGKLILEEKTSGKQKSILIKTDLASGIYNLRIPELSSNGKLVIR